MGKVVRSSPAGVGLGVFGLGFGFGFETQNLNMTVKHCQPLSGQQGRWSHKRHAT